MIFNYCLHGKIEPFYNGEISIELYNKELTKIFSKTINSEIDINNESYYQFNLGDRDLFDINHLLDDGSSCVITINNKYYKVKLNQDIFLHKFNIDLNEIMNPSNTEAEDSDDLLETIRIVTDKIILRETDENLYGYYEVQKDGIKVYSENEELNWIPRENGDYSIIHRVYNASNLEVSESIINISVLENYIETNSIDYIFYSKRDKIVQIEVPDYVMNTVILDKGFYIENSKIYGKLENLIPVSLLYSRGKITIKPQIGDILDY